jgi:hypothetical protein
MVPAAMATVKTAFAAVFVLMVSKSKHRVSPI